MKIIITLFETLADYGFRFVEFCSICKNRYKVFKNPDKPHIEIKAHVSGGYFKLYSPDSKGRIRQSAFGNADKLKEIITTL